MFTADVIRILASPLQAVGGVLGALEVKLAGGRFARAGSGFGSELGDLGPAGVEPLAKRIGAGALRGERDRWCVLLAQLADANGAGVPVRVARTMVR